MTASLVGAVRKVGQRPASTRRRRPIAERRCSRPTCTACHDTARFTGSDFLAGWTGKPLHALFDHVTTTMPEDNPGSLKPQQYADVVAYFLKLNGYPAGKAELQDQADALKGIAVR